MAKPQSDAIQTASKQWGQRIKQYAPILQQNPAALKGAIDVAVKDIKGVLSGNTAMTNDEAVNAISAIAGGHDLVQKHHGSHGILGTLFNIPKDIGETAMAIPSGLYNFAHHLPSETTKTIAEVTHAGDDKWLKAHGYEAQNTGGLGHEIAAAFRNTAKSPLLSMVPGVTDVANLTTAKGRQQLQEHPVQAFLDVLPYVSAAAGAVGGSLASFTLREAEQAGVVAREGATVAEATKEALKLQERLQTGGDTSAFHPDAFTNLQKLEENFNGKNARPRFGTNSPHGGVFHLAEPGSVTESLMQKNPIRAAMRWTDQYALPKTRLTTAGQFGEWTSAALERSGVSRTVQDAGKALARNNRIAASHLESFNNAAKHLFNNIKANGKVAGRRSSAELAQIADIASRVLDDGKTYIKALDASGNITETAAIPEHLIPFVEQARLLAADVARNDKRLWKLKVGGQEVIYGNSPAERALMRAKNELDAANADLFSLRDHLDTRQLYMEQRANQISTESMKIQQQLADAGKSGTNVRDVASLQRKLQALNDESKTLMEKKFRHITVNRKSMPGFMEAEREYQDSLANVQDKTQKFNALLDQTPSTAHEPVLAEVRKQAFKQHLEENGPLDLLDPTQHIDDAIAEIDAGGSPFSKEVTQAINEDVKATWQNLTKQGFSPVWMPKVRPEDMRKTMNFINASAHPLTTAFDFRPSVSNAAVQLEVGAFQTLKTQALDAFHEQMVAPHVKTWEEVKPEILRIAQERLGKETRVGFDDNALRQEALDQGWRLWNPDSHGFTVPDMYKEQVGNLYVPKHVFDAVDRVRSAGSFERTPLGKIAVKSTNVMKTSVMTLSPKHLAHIIAGGTFFVMAGGGLEEVLNIPKAIKLVRSGQFDESISRSLYGVNESITQHFHDPMKTVKALEESGSPTQAWHYGKGRTLGRVWTSLGDGVDQVRRFEDFIGNTQRVTAFLGEKQRALRAGYTNEAAINMGLRHAERMLIDFDSLTPMEKGIVREVFPFYGFTRHIVRYALTYPIDHPLRASILARLAAQEQAHWSSDLPTQFQRLFFLGGGGGLGEVPQHGKVTALDVRAVNPFRDLERTLSVAGFVSSLNPALQGIARFAGYNPAQGGPELYPHLIVDPLTGSFKAAPRHDAPLQALEGFVPEIGSLDYLLGWSDQMRSLQRTNPDAFHRELFNTLLTPSISSYNIDVEKAAVSKRYLKEAQTAVSDVSGGRADPSTLLAYEFVPFQGQLLPSRTVASIFSILDQVGGGKIAPRAIIPKPKPFKKKK